MTPSSSAAATTGRSSPATSLAPDYVCVLERTPHFGGGACTSEGPAPGYLMNHCSHWTRFYGHPAYRDFDLATRASLRLPGGNEGMIFDDGSSFVGYSASRVVDGDRREERSRTGSTAPSSRSPGSSRRDAETYLSLLDALRRALEGRLPPPSLHPAPAVGYARSARGSCSRSPRAGSSRCTR